MIEEDEGPEATSRPGNKGADAAALALALAQTGKLDPRAAAYLEEQTALARRQNANFDEDQRLATQAAKRKRYYDRVKNGFATIAAFLAAALVVLFAAMVVDAIGDRGLVIEPFSVPPSLASDGLSGEVVASRFLDKLQAMQTATQSERPADSYQNNWSSDIKVAIPETGLTFGELQKLLRDKLGHETHISGEILRTPAGIAITARWGDAAPQTFTGTLDDFDRLAQQSAEAVYRVSQPYRYAQFLAQHGRVPEAIPVLAGLAANGSPAEQGWAFAQWGLLDLNNRGDLAAARLHLRKGYALGNNGSAILAAVGLLNLELWSGHDEQVLDYSKILDTRSQIKTPGTTEQFFEVNRLVARGYLLAQMGDFREAAAQLTRLASLHGGGYADSFIGAAAAGDALAHDHDPAAARSQLATVDAGNDTAFLPLDADQGWTVLPFYLVAAMSQDWQGALAQARASDAWLDTAKQKHKVLGLLQQVLVRPLEALALAKAGDIAGAEASIATTPGDCYLCVRVRGLIAAQKHDAAGAVRWFAIAAHLAPSLPFAFTDWGQMLLANGDAGGAIAKFRQANAVGPHFADPLEMWGEALMLQNRSDLALAKFADADRYAPDWGRLHLKWGEALFYAGRRGEAEKQFALAAKLFLTAAEKTELAKARATRG